MRISCFDDWPQKQHNRTASIFIAIRQIHLSQVYENHQVIYGWFCDDASIRVRGRFKNLP